nr:MAG TPA: YWFCY protein [Caudoviricetes sp.]
MLRNRSAWDALDKIIQYILLFFISLILYHFYIYFSTV